MGPEDKRKAIEVEILKVMKEKLEKGEMDAERAGQIARFTLKVLHPGISLEELYKVVPTLDDQFAELSAVVVPILREYDEKIETLVRGKVEELIRQGHFSEASDLAKKVVQKDINVTK